LKELAVDVARDFAGSYGLIYEYDEQLTVPGGRGVFSVTVIKRGQCLPSMDPFLSPGVPVFEDPEP
jgi:hypothetical protein